MYTYCTNPSAVPGATLVRLLQKKWSLEACSGYSLQGHIIWWYDAMITPRYFWLSTSKVVLYRSECYYNSMPVLVRVYGTKYRCGGFLREHLLQVAVPPVVLGRKIKFRSVYQYSLVRVVSVHPPHPAKVVLLWYYRGGSSQEDSTFASQMKICAQEQ